MTQPVDRLRPVHAGGVRCHVMKGVAAGTINSRQESVGRRKNLPGGGESPNRHPLVRMGESLSALVRQIPDSLGCGFVCYLGAVLTAGKDRRLLPSPLAGGVKSADVWMPASGLASTQQHVATRRAERRPARSHRSTRQRWEQAGNGRFLTRATRQSSTIAVTSTTSSRTNRGAVARGLSGTRTRSPRRVRDANILR